MNLHPEHDPNIGPEALPADFEPALRRLDDRIADLARLDSSHESVPSGLSERIFHASVSSLPTARAVPAAGRWRPRLVGGRLAAGGWGGARRLGLAAVLGVTCVLGVMMGRSIKQPAAPPVVELAADIDWLAADPLEAMDLQVAHLLDTGGLSSMSDLTGELSFLVAGREVQN